MAPGRKTVIVASKPTKKGTTVTDKAKVIKTRPAARTKRIKPPSLLDKVLSSTFDKRASSKQDRPGVLVRPTARAQKHSEVLAAEQARQQAMDQKPRRLMMLPMKAAQQTPEEIVQTKPPFLLDMPPEVLTKICNFVVVQTSFVYPTSETGREQPDLAMTCRALRQIALPIYYSQNLFAIELTPAAGEKVYTSQLYKWLKEQSQWLMHVQHWIFTVEQAEDDSEGVLVDIVLPESYVSTREGLVVMPMPAVELHSDARCLLSQTFPFNRSCNLRPHPFWLADLMNRFLGQIAPYSGRFDAYAVQMLRSELMKTRSHLGPLCCRFAESVYNSRQHGVLRPLIPRMVLLVDEKAPIRIVNEDDSVA